MKAENKIGKTKNGGLGNVLLILSYGFLLSLLLIFAEQTAGQSPVSWELKTSNAVAHKPGDKLSAQITATIDPGWHLYSITQGPGGPNPTKITLAEGQSFKIEGKIISPKPVIKLDQNFKIKTETHSKSAIFTVPLVVAVNAAAGTQSLQINVRFQVCTETTCLPPTTVKLNASVEIAGSSATASASQNKPSEVRTNAGQNELKTGMQVPDFSFTDFEGKARKFSEFRGKYVLLDFWATWCKPCLADIPKLKTLYEKYKAGGFEIIGMDSETIGDEADAPDPEFAKETAERAKQIVTTRGVTWTQATSETAVPLAVKVFGVKALPTKILIDKDGKVIATIGEKDDLTGIVEKLLSANK